MFILHILWQIKFKKCIINYNIRHKLSYLLTFFEKLGYVQGEQPPQRVLEFFNDCYKFVLREVGYHGSDENILSAVIHFDETTPHLQLYYVPIVDQGKKKVYVKGSDGKVLRNEKGSPIQAKDVNGNVR